MAESPNLSRASFGEAGILKAPDQIFLPRHAKRDYSTKTGSKIMIEKKIIVNGKEYHSLEEVPEEFRKFLEDKDGNNIPDFIQDRFGNLPSGSFETIKVETSEKVFNSGDGKDPLLFAVEELPPMLLEKMADCSREIIDGKEFVSAKDLPEGFTMITGEDKSFAGKEKKSVPAESSSYDYQDFDPKYESQKQSNTLLWVIIGLLVILLVIAVGFIIYFATK